LLRSPVVGVKKRALLYGLNEAFLEGLAGAGAELVEVNEAATGMAPLERSQREVDQARRATFLLVSQVADAFTAAHRINPHVAPLPSGPRGRAGEMGLAKHTPDVPSVRSAEVVVLSVDDGRASVPQFFRPVERVVRPAPIPRVIDVGD